MSAMPKPYLTESQYLAIERAADFKSEYYRGEMFAMSGAKWKHNRVRDNLSRQLGNLLDGGPCVPMNSDMRLKVPATGLYTYPDVMVICGEPQFINDKEEDILLNPKIVVEVLSPSTERYDRGKKFEHYRSIDSLREYWLFAQDRIGAERFVRQADGTWPMTPYDETAPDIEMPSIRVKVSLKAIYAGVVLQAGDPLIP